MTPANTEIFKKIEAPEFYASQNLASTVSGFVNGLDASPVFSDLQFAVSSGRLSMPLLQRRMELLCADDASQVYESPFDVALAAYVLALSRVHPVVAMQSARRLRGVPGLWWAAKLASTVEQSASAFVTLADHPIPSVSTVLAGPASRQLPALFTKSGEVGSDSDLVMWDIDRLAAEVVACCRSSANGNLAFGAYPSVVSIPDAVVAQWQLSRA